jgi:hypothetical protein
MLTKVVIRSTIKARIGKCILDERPRIFIRNKPIFSSERMLHEDYYRKGSVGKKFCGRESQRA